METEQKHNAVFKISVVFNFLEDTKLIFGGRFLKKKKAFNYHSTFL